MVLPINNHYWAEIFAQEPGNGARSLRHAAYTQFVLWRHGRLGHNIRRVIPSCVVWRIRDRFPSPDNLYTGYQVSHLARHVTLLGVKTWLSTLEIVLSLCLSEETLKAVGPFYLVSMPGEVKDPTSLYWKCVTCGLHILT